MLMVLGYKMQDKTGKRRAVTEAGGSMKMTYRLSSYGGTPFSTWKCSVNSKLLMCECDRVKMGLQLTYQKTESDSCDSVIASLF